MEPLALAEARPSAHPRWMRQVLLAAAFYNIGWGGSVVLAPDWLFVALEMEPPRYVWLWQCIGMIVGVYGVGYAAAASGPLRHWPIVLAGFLGKLFGPIGFLWAAGSGEVPWGMGWMILFNDLIWLAPFALILDRAYQAWVDDDVEAGRWREAPLAEPMHTFRSQHGCTLAELADPGPVMLVFLRHFGCTFCREAVAEIRRERPCLDRNGVTLAFVHMSPPHEADRFFALYGMDDVHHFSDIDRELYRAFELRRGRLGQLFGPKVWWRGLIAGVLRGHGIGGLKGDGFQMPGVFVLCEGRVVSAYRHGSAADRPDYCAMAECVEPEPAPA